MMKLNVGSVMTTRVKEIDLEWLATMNDDVDDVESMYGVLVARLARWALTWDISLDSIVPQYINDGSGDTLAIQVNSEKPRQWIWEVAQFAYWIKSDMPTWDDEDIYYAYIENQGWRWTNFDTLSDDARENLLGENMDDEEYGKYWLNEVGEGIPEHLEEYFDYEAYGAYLLSESQETEWNGKTFKYSE